MREIGPIRAIVPAVAAALILGALAPRQAPGAEPISGPLELAARRVRAWREGGAQWLFLDRDVRIRAGDRGFAADRAAVRIAAAEGHRRIAAMLEGARPLPGKQAVQLEGERLFVTLRVKGQPVVQADLLEREPAEQPLVKRLRRRLSPDDGAAAEAAQSPDAILPPDARVSFDAERVVYRGGSDRAPPAALLFGDIRLMLTGSERTTTLEAQRAVVFLKEGAGDEPLAQGGSLEGVTGIYLEGRVIASDGTHTVRAPRVFYDRTHQRALIVDAVISSWDADRSMPVYLRAERVRQEARRRFSAEEAQLATSAFAAPQIALSAGELTVQAAPSDRAGSDKDGRRKRNGSARLGRFRAEDVAFEFAGTPVFYWPRVAGPIRKAGRLPLLDADLDVRDNEGNLEVHAHTEWDLLALAGIAPDDAKARARIGWRGDHGAALGADAQYPGGALRGTFLPSDGGTDEIGSRRDIERDGDPRGRVRFRHRETLGEGWEAKLEAAYVSDATFLEEFEEGDAEAGRRDKTRARLEHRSGSRLFSLTVSHDVNDLLPQLTTLQSPGHVVDRAPELTYHETGRGLLGGDLVWRSANRLGRVRIVPGDDRPSDRGFTDRQSAALFGIPDADTPFDDARAARGVPLGFVGRLDSRQELALPFDVGPLEASAYTVGRVTAYDQSFEDFRGEGHAIRFWGGAGLRATGAWHRSYDDVRSRLLNLDRLRHVVEPRMHLFFAEESLSSRDLPVFDPEVERIADGWMTAWGLRQTLQTKRGGPGRRRSVDWLVLDSELVFRADDPATASPLARFFGHRPERSRGGDHWRQEARFRVTESLTAVGDATFGFEGEALQRWRMGAVLDHGPRLQSWARYIDIAAFDTQTIASGFDYRLTRKYRLGFSQAIDLATGDLRTLDLELARRFPQWRLALGLSVDELGETQSFTVRIEPGRERERSPLERLQ